MPAEEIIDRVPAVERREAVRAAQRQEQRHRKAAVQVRQCDQHEAAARPDVQRMLLNLVRAGGRGGQRQLLVTVLEHVLGDAHAELPGHRAPHDRSCAVGRDQRRHAQTLRVASHLVQHRELVAVEVDRTRGVQKLRAYAVHALRVIEQHAIETRPRHGEDHLVRALPVGHEALLPVERVQHAAAHRDEKRLDLLEHAGFLERLDAARGEREIDRAAGVHVHLAQVGAPLVEHDLAGVARQEDRHQRARETRAQDRDVRVHAASSARSASAKRHASSKLL